MSEIKAAYVAMLEATEAYDRAVYTAWMESGACYDTSLETFKENLERQLGETT